MKHTTTTNSADRVTDWEIESPHDEHRLRLRRWEQPLCRLMQRVACDARHTCDVVPTLEFIDGEGCADALEPRRRSCALHASPDNRLPALLAVPSTEHANAALRAVFPRDPKLDWKRPVY